MDAVLARKRSGLKIYNIFGLPRMCERANEGERGEKGDILLNGQQTAPRNRSETRKRADWPKKRADVGVPGGGDGGGDGEVEPSGVPISSVAMAAVAESIKFPRGEQRGGRRKRGLLREGEEELHRTLSRGWNSLRFGEWHRHR